MLEQCCNQSKKCRSNIATLCCVKNRRCESSRVTSTSLMIRRLSQYSCQRFLKVCTSQMTLIFVSNCKTGKLYFVFTRVLTLIFLHVKYQHHMFLLFEPRFQSQGSKELGPFFIYLHSSHHTYTFLERSLYGIKTSTCSRPPPQFLNFSFFEKFHRASQESEARKQMIKQKKTSVSLVLTFITYRPCRRKKYAL